MVQKVTSKRFNFKSCLLVTQIFTCHFYPYPSLDIGSLLLIRSHFLISKHCKDRSFLGVKSFLHTQERPILMSFCRSLMVLFSLTTCFPNTKPVLVIRPYTKIWSKLFTKNMNKSIVRTLHLTRQSFFTEIDKKTRHAYWCTMTLYWITETATNQIIFYNYPPLARDFYWFNQCPWTLNPTTSMQNKIKFWLCYQQQQ